MKGITFLGNVSLECTIDGLYENALGGNFGYGRNQENFAG